jgi:hypothetical protein
MRLLDSRAPESWNRNHQQADQQEHGTDNEKVAPPTTAKPLDVENRIGPREPTPEWMRIGFLEVHETTGKNGDDTTNNKEKWKASGHAPSMVVRGCLTVSA